MRGRHPLLATLVPGTLIFALSLLGCATTSSTPKSVTELNQLVGSWNGRIGNRDGVLNQSRATLSIREDGTYVVVGRTTMFYGRIGIQDGVVQWGFTDLKEPWIGT